MSKPKQRERIFEGEASLEIDNGCMKDMNMGSDPGVRLQRPSLMLHSCCGPCSTAVIERLVPDYELTVFFYNPNIDDETEYRLRRDAQLEVIRRYNEDNCLMRPVAFIEGRYDPQNFLEAVAGMEDEPEGGARCTACFRMRLEETARVAVAGGADFFTTTLTVSPHKNYDLISKIGQQVGEEYGIAYLDEDFKKRGGFQRSIELSRKLGLYRQRFCGCGFSRWED